MHKYLYYTAIANIFKEYKYFCKYVFELDCTYEVSINQFSNPLSNETSCELAY